MVVTRVSNGRIGSVISMGGHGNSSVAAFFLVRADVRVSLFLHGSVKGAVRAGGQAVDETPVKTVGITVW